MEHSLHGQCWAVGGASARMHGAAANLHFWDLIGCMQAQGITCCPTTLLISGLSRTWRNWARALALAFWHGLVAWPKIYVNCNSLNLWIWSNC